jgi:16S rRNA A1518/A1519 N6-dimethyltransferase RsmA/KsgA/DIM1 with predicted DNA glycosylase/AP lyase activity
MKDVKTGWERENRTRFDEIVVNYDKARWDYPQEMFADIFEYSGSREGMKAIEIGPGTGKSTTPVLDAGHDVTAVELGANMAEFLLEKHKNYKNFIIPVLTP